MVVTWWVMESLGSLAWVSLVRGYAVCCNSDNTSSRWRCNADVRFLTQLTRRESQFAFEVKDWSHNEHGYVTCS